MEPFSAIQPQRAGKLRYVLCDIDDTITTDGKLPAESTMPGTVSSPSPGGPPGGATSSSASGR